MDAKDFSTRLRGWYRDAKRDLPWRQTQNPYAIWLSEVILQQTRVDQGLAYYYRFLEAFPDVAALAEASEEQVLRLWQGLGYYSRGRNLLKAARQVVDVYQGAFPADYQQLKRLSGVGEYTAAAIASFAFGLPHAVVDGNVYRVLSRYAGIATPIDSGRGKSEFAELAVKLLDSEHAAEHNQAIMELGATVCKPRQPACGACPLQYGCHAFANNIVQNLPVKAGRQEVKRVRMTCFFVEDGRRTWIRKRVGKGIWQGLYEFPTLIHDNDSPTAAELAQFLPQIPLVQRSVQHEVRHLLSHRELVVDFIHFSSNSALPAFSGFELVELAALNEFALPRLFTRYLQDEGVLN